MSALTVSMIALGASLVTVLLLGVALSVGYRFGLLAARRLTIGTGTTLDHVPAAEQLAEFKPVAFIVIEKTRALQELQRELASVVPAVLREAIEQIWQTVQQLQDQLERTRDAADFIRSPPNTDQVQALSDALLTSESSPQRELIEEPRSLAGKLTDDEIQSLASLPSDPANEASDPTKRRYPYDCHQVVHPWNPDGPSQSIEPGVSVRCHDISTEGISFFWPNAPDFERLIISVGSSENPNFMAAEVKYSKAVYMHEEVCYLVGCRFAGRVPEFSEQTRVHFNKWRTRLAVVATTRSKAVQGSDHSLAH